MPRISVVLPVRNGEATIEAALQSILLQSYDDFNLVVVDDGSTDNTAFLIKNIADKDPRVSYIKGEGKGGAIARNLGINSCDSEYIAAMDADDVAQAERLAVQIQVLDNDPSLVVVGTHIAWFGDKTGRPRMVSTKQECRTALKLFSPLCHPTILLRRKAFYEAGQYANVRLLAEDYDLFCRLSYIGELANIPQPLLAYNIHAKQSSQKQKNEQRHDMWKTVYQHHLKLSGASHISYPQMLARLVKTGLALGPFHATQSLRALRDCVQAMQNK